MSTEPARPGWRPVILGLAVGGLFLAYAARRGDWDDVWRITLQAQLQHVLGIAAATLAFLAVKALRWRMLLARMSSRASAPLFASVAIGAAANYGIPHLGEVVRAALARRDTGLPFGPLLASIVTERVLDLVAIAGAAVLLGLAYPDNARFVEAARLVGLGGAAALALIALVLARPAYLLRVIDRLVSVLPTPWSRRLSGAARDAIVGLEPLASASTLAATLGMTTIQWALMAAGIAFALLSAGVAITLAATTATLVFSVVGLLLPSAPGYTGTTQVAFLWALTSLGVSETASLAASVVYNAVVVGTVLLIAGSLLLMGRRNVDD